MQGVGCVQRHRHDIVLRLAYAGGRLYDVWAETTDGRTAPQGEHGFFDNFEIGK
jgi:hypothetical protein